MLLLQAQSQKYRFKKCGAISSESNGNDVEPRRAPGRGRMSLAGETPLPPCMEGLSSQGEGEKAVTELIRYALNVEVFRGTCVVYDVKKWTAA